MLKLVCSRHRYHSGRENNGEDTKRVHALDPSKDGCDALFEIIRKDKDIWMVSKLILEHSHELNPAPASRVRRVRSQGEVLVIAKNFTDTRNLLLNGQDSQHPREMQYNDLGPEDAESLFEYLKKAQAGDPALFYAVQRNKNGYTANIFWADAKARMVYYHFGDAVRFETRYRKNKENIPIVIFLGVNHHVQPVVFGCALLVDESEASFAWLFEKWLEAMCGGPPVSLLTEFNRGMADAVAKAAKFPTQLDQFSLELHRRFQSYLTGPWRDHFRHVHFSKVRLVVKKEFNTSCMPYFKLNCIVTKGTTFSSG
uniref:Protein FAR1-RELATED SEQUENCE n=1 Tax=Arundo donax TaxID=35708 RepID=A0A0A9D4X8_ARUDO